MDAYLIVDPDSRNITIPEIESAFGVYGDNNAERKYFKSPRIVGNGIDLTECYLYVNYISASTKIGQILCDVGDAPNGTATEDEIVFSWPITRNVLDKNVSGEIFFAVQAKTKTGDTVFTTRKAKGNCYESIEGTETVAEEYADIILQLLSRMDKVEENIGLEVDNYFKENPVVTSEYLTQTLQPVKNDVNSIKEEISDSLGELRYHGKFTSGSKYSTVDTSIAPKKGDLIFFRVDENNSALFSSISLFLYYTDNNYDTVTISKVGDYKFVVAQKDYIKSIIGCELSQADATEPTWSATVMSSEKHSLTGSLMLFYSLLDSGIELRKNDIENLKTDFISKHSKRFVVSKSINNTYLDFTVDANDKGLIFVSETNATKFTAYDLYGHKPDDTFELLESNISVVGSIHTYDNNNRYDRLRIVFKCSAPSTSDEYISAVCTTDTDCRS